MTAERTVRMTGLLVREHHVRVPVDRADPHRFGSIDVFAREIVDPARDGEDLPLLLFLQGGPGGMGPRPTSGGGWWTTALETHRVVLLDQRGTGRSAPVTSRVVASFEDAETAADYLACFRADAIVEDAEALRHAVYGRRRWSTLGQSYGGFITLTYLSRRPEALVSCWTTGGLPPVHATAEEVYARTVPRQLARNRAFERAFPDDVGTLALLADAAASGEVLLPDGDRLTVDRLRVLGASLGMSTGADELHWLLETAVEPDGAPSDVFLAEVARRTGFTANPLYMVMQETIYHQGRRDGGWAAHAVHAAEPAMGPALRPVPLTGEAVFPWMFDEVRALRPFRAAAETLAARTEWPELYDLGVLASNEVPLGAVQYVDDPYVDLDLALDAADAVGASNTWVTNEFLHDGLRVAAATILPRLRDLTAGRAAVTRR